MKKRMTIAALVLSTTLVFTACGTNSPAENNTTGNQNIENNQKGGNNSPESSGISLALLSVTVADIGSTLKVGSSRDEVTSLFDESKADVKLTKKDDHVWRYDVGAESGYTYGSFTDPDLTGLKQEKLPLQVFVHFDDNGKVSSYSAYQYSSDGYVSAHRLSADGELTSENL